MSFDITRWMEELVRRLQETFGARLTAVGLQGSFKRGEETTQSDIDAVVVLDRISPADITAYKSLLAQMPDASHPVCGFFGGKEDLKNWSRAELFQFGQDTRLFYGSLEGILPPPTRQDAALAAQAGAGTVYHALVHTWVHGELTADFLRSLRKNLFFALQAAHFARTGQYVTNKQTLLEGLQNSAERAGLQTPPPAETLPQTAGKILRCCQRLLAEFELPLK